MKKFFINIKWKVHLETLVFVALIVVGGTLPLWLGILIPSLWNSSHGITDIILKGEFFLFSAAFLTHAIYLLFTYSKKSWDTTALVGWVSILLLIVSSVMYGVVITPKEVLARSIQLNINLVIVGSTLCFCFSLFSLYLGIYKDNEKKQELDVAAEIRGDVEDIKDQLA